MAGDLSEERGGMQFAQPLLAKRVLSRPVSLLNGAAVGIRVVGDEGGDGLLHVRRAAGDRMVTRSGCTLPTSE